MLSIEDIPIYSSKRQFEGSSLEERAMDELKLTSTGAHSRVPRTNTSARIHIHARTHTSPGRSHVASERVAGQQGVPTWPATTSKDKQSLAGEEVPLPSVAVTVAAQCCAP